MSTAASDSFVLEPAWRALQSTLGRDALASPLLPSTLALLLYVLLVTPLTLAHYYQPSFVRPYLIRPDYRPTWPELRKCLANLAFGQTLFFAPAVLAWLAGARVPVPDAPPSLGVALGQLAAALLLFDAGFFVGHKAMHVNKTLFRIAHAQHHEFKTTSALVAQYVHPLEMLAVFAAGMLPTLVLDMHPLTLLVYLSLLSLNGIEHHSGFAPPAAVDLHTLSGGFYAGARWHEYHHARPTKNIAAMFTVWDVLVGDTAYVELPYVRLVRRLIGGDNSGDDRGGAGAKRK